MNDYISRESVNHIILETIRYCNNQSDQINDLILKFSWGKCSSMLESVKESVDNIPDADVRPVVYGEWDSNDCCTNCGEEADYNWERGIHFYSDFCSNCGADMRENKQRKV